MFLLLLLLLLLLLVLFPPPFFFLPPEPSPGPSLALLLPVMVMLATLEVRSSAVEDAAAAVAEGWSAIVAISLTLRTKKNGGGKKSIFALITQFSGVERYLSTPIDHEMC